MTTMTAPTRRQKEAVTASPLYIQGDIGLNQPKVSDGKPAVMLVPVEASVDMPPPASSQPAFVQRILGDATRVSSVIPAKSVDLIVTSPPYWQKRDYGHADQLGQEATPAEYVQALIGAMRDWKKVLKNTGSIEVV
ncbi:DNA methyltransferase [Hymenobacter sp. 102]|uniref:DNA methyltransferase n=1 Tax=Hymenobacter sp. 102 TaxID=3403152 RepID=UPI003CF8FD32